MAKPTRANFNQVVRDALTLAGYSHYKVLNACNSALGELTLTKQGEDKTKEVKITGRKEPKLAVNVQPGTEQYSTHHFTMPLQFVAWNDGLNAAIKVSSDFSVTIPKMFTDWLDRLDFKAPVKEPVTT